MSVQSKNIRNLLKEVGVRIERSKEISMLKGENFNIFSILGLEYKENKTHSNFITSLLNPKGEHGLGDAFLQLFYDMLIPIISSENKQRIIEELRDETISVKTEDSEGIESGRIDISIRGNSGIIFIENKINAGDQAHQISKYSNAHEQTNKIVFYLTLDGHLPSEVSTLIMGESKQMIENQDFFILTYKDDITEWLENCLKESADYPIIRETIKQYLILIKKLTGQLTTQKEMDEIYDLIKKNYSYAITISNNIPEVRAEMVESLFIMMKKLLSTKLGSNWSIEYQDIREKYNGFILKKNTWQDINIGWSGNPYLLSSQSVLGIIFGESSKRNLLRDRLSNTEHSHLLQKYKFSTQGWMAFRKIYLGDSDFTKLASKESFEDYSHGLVKEMYNLAKVIDEQVIEINKE